MKTPIEAMNLNPNLGEGGIASTVEKGFKQNIEQAIHSLQISSEEEGKIVLEKKYPEELVHRSFANIRGLVENFFKIATQEGFVDHEKLKAKEKLLDTYEYIDFREAAKKDLAFKKVLLFEEVLNDINNEVQFLKENGFLGLAANEQYIDKVLDSGVYKGSDAAYRKRVEEALHNNMGNTEGVTYASFVDSRELEKAKSHGRILFKLNPAMFSKSTFTVGDSLSGNSFPSFLERQVSSCGYDEGGRIDFALKRQILPEHVALAKALLNLDKKYDQVTFRETSTYVEAQILGGVNIDSEISEVFIDKDLYTSHAFRVLGDDVRQKFEQRFKDRIKITTPSIGASFPHE